MSERCALVTGCSKGLGRSFVLLLKAQGYRVIGISRSKFSSLDDDLKDSLDEYVELDLSDRSAVNEFLKGSLKINCLVLNASSRSFQEFNTFSDKEICNAMDGDFTNQLRILRACLDYMTQENFGQIVIISSRSAVSSYSTGSLYCSVKSAWRSLYFSLLKEFKDSGIKFFLFVPDAFSNGRGHELRGYSFVMKRLNVLVKSLHEGKESKVFMALTFTSRIRLMMYRVLIFLRHAF